MLALLHECRADARAKLACRLTGVGDHEHRIDAQLHVADSPYEARHQNRGLACAGASRDEHLASCLDRLELPVVHHERAVRHIVQRSHHGGHSPPFGSSCTSPCRMRWA